MLDIIRNLVASIFGKILLGIMVLSFALWGVGDLLNSGNSQLAAKVSKQKITLDDFYYEFQRSIDDFNNSLERRITLAEAYEEKIMDKNILAPQRHDRERPSYTHCV